MTRDQQKTVVGVYTQLAVQGVLPKEGNELVSYLVGFLTRSKEDQNVEIMRWLTLVKGAHIEAIGEVEMLLKDPELVAHVEPDPSSST